MESTRSRRRRRGGLAVLVLFVRKVRDLRVRLRCQRAWPPPRIEKGLRRRPQPRKARGASGLGVAGVACGGKRGRGAVALHEEERDATGRPPRPWRALERAAEARELRM